MSASTETEAELPQRAILVTGVAGFIGSRLARKGLVLGRQVVGIDRSDPPTDLAIHPNYHHFRVDLPSGAVGTICREHLPELLFHAAGPASVQESLQDPLTDFQATLPAVASILEVLRLQRTPSKFIYLSSAAVYGNPDRLPVSEEQVPRPLSPYGFHKYMGELAVREYATIYGVPACTARVFSAYGPGLRRQVMWDICLKSNAAVAAPLFGTGQETRDFVHVDDVTKGLYLLAASAEMAGEAYNLASGVQTSISELAHMLTRFMGLSSTPRFSGPTRVGDPLHWWADVSKISALGFQPQIELQQGVRQYAEWFLREGRAPNPDGGR